MRGIRMKHGVTFVEIDNITIRINADGSCDLSPVMLPSLEWELRTEPPQNWTYITSSDIDSYGEDTKRQIEEILNRVRRITEE